MPITIVEYDRRWPEMYEVEAALLKRVLGDVVRRIEHVGSTAVPGLAAKPIIDIQVSVPDITDIDSFRIPLEAAGYFHRGDPDNDEHEYFRKPPEGTRTHQVHVCPSGSEWERYHLVFRDYLRTHPDAAARYEAEKRRLAPNFDDQKTILYAEAKDPFIRAMQKDADEWAKERA